MALKKYTIIIVIVLAVLWVANFVDRRNKCEQDALENSVSAYTIRDYPNVVEREQMQKKYQGHYMELCN